MPPSLPLTEGEGPHLKIASSPRSEQTKGAREGSEVAPGPVSVPLPRCRPPPGDERPGRRQTVAPPPGPISRGGHFLSRPQTTVRSPKQPEPPTCLAGVSKSSFAFGCCCCCCCFLFCCCFLPSLVLPVPFFLLPEAAGTEEEREASSSGAALQHFIKGRANDEKDVKSGQN